VNGVQSTPTGLEALVGGEHAAVYGYAAAGPVLVGLSAPVALLAAARTGYDAHRASRDALVDAIAAAGGTAPPALPSYSVPFPLTSTAAVVRFLAGIEDRLCGVAAAAAGVTSTPSHRLLAVGVLSAAAVRATRLKELGGAAPSASVTPLPGLPGR
jgi:Domain of unknown function (DUF4439)